MGYMMNRLMNPRFLIVALLMSLMAFSQPSYLVQGDFQSTAAESKSGRIAYVGLDGNIYTSDPMGAQRVAVTDDAGNTADIAIGYRQPTWSFDGGRLAFIGYVRGREGSIVTSVYNARPDGIDRVEVFRDKTLLPFYLYWSPNREHISFISVQRSGGFELRIVPATGGRPQSVGSGQPIFWSWAPEGDFLVTHIGGSGIEQPQMAKMALHEIGGNRISEVELSAEPTYFQAPVFSPDGRSFVVASEQHSGRSSLVLSSTDGRHEQILAELQGAATFDWSPQGNRLAYVDGQVTPLGGIMGPLKIIDLVNTATIVNHQADNMNVVAFFWSPDGDKIAYFEPTVVQTEQGESWLAMNISILDVVKDKLIHLGSIKPTQAFVRQVVPFYDQYQRSATIWSPDSKYIVVSAVASDDQPGVFVVPVADDSQPYFIDHGISPFWSWE